MEREREREGEKVKARARGREKQKKKAKRKREKERVPEEELAQTQWLPKLTCLQRRTCLFILLLSPDEDVLRGLHWARTGASTETTVQPASRQTDTHAYTHTHTDVYTHRRVHTDKYTQRHTHTHTYTHRLSLLAIEA